MTPNRHGSAVIEFPNELDVVTTREFDAPLAARLRRADEAGACEHWFAPFEDQVTECSIDLRVGGDYHIGFVTEDGTECSFRGTYLEVEPPTRTVATWLFEGWPDADAVETMELHETDGVTTLTTHAGVPRPGRPRPHDQVRRPGATVLQQQARGLLEITGRLQLPAPGRWCSLRPGASTMAPAMADERELSLQEQLEEIGAQLDWVRGYL